MRSTLPAHALLCAALAAATRFADAHMHHASLPQLSLWPAHASASLAVSEDPCASPCTGRSLPSRAVSYGSSALAASPSWSISASSGGILAVHTAGSTSSLPGVDLSSITSITVAWTPARAPSSTTFDRVFGDAAPTKLPFLHAAGVHIQVMTGAPGTQGIATAEAAIQAAMRQTPLFLRRALPELDREDSGFLARSLCAPTGFQHHATNGSTVCLAASFPHRHVDLAALLKWFPVHALPGDFAPRAAAVTFRPTGDTDRPISAELFVATVSLAGSLDSASLRIHPKRHVFVQSIDQHTATASISSVLRSENQPVATVQYLPQVASTAQSGISISIVGEGFHRRVRVDMAQAPGFNLCPSGTIAEGKLLLAVPLSKSVYADLDELHRMERFGGLGLHSPTKHIEIERPASVSAQHVIALEFDVHVQKDGLAVEFPVHLRYHSPANDSFYAAASIIAPEIFVSCSPMGASTNAAERALDGPLDGLFRQWVTDPVWTATRWHRVFASSPLLETAVPVPVGFTPHGFFVSVITLSVTSLGALLLVLVAVRTPSRGATQTCGSSWKPKTQRE